MEFIEFLPYHNRRICFSYKGKNKIGTLVDIIPLNFKKNDEHILFPPHSWEWELEHKNLLLEKIMDTYEKGTPKQLKELFKKHQIEVVNVEDVTNVEFITDEKVTLKAYGYLKHHILKNGTILFGVTIKNTSKKRQKVKLFDENFVFKGKGIDNIDELKKPLNLKEKVDLIRVFSDKIEQYQQPLKFYWKNVDEKTKEFEKFYKSADKTVRIAKTTEDCLVGKTGVEKLVMDKLTDIFINEDVGIEYEILPETEVELLFFKDTGIIKKISQPLNATRLNIINNSDEVKTAKLFGYNKNIQQTNFRNDKEIEIRPSITDTPYDYILNESGQIKLKVRSIRLLSDSITQLKMPIKINKQNIFGESYSTYITTERSFSENQLQKGIVDIDVEDELVIDRNTELEIEILPKQKLTVNLYGFEL